MARTGPCSPWIQGSDVSALPKVAAAITASPYTLTSAQAQALCANAAAAASELLYIRSGRVYSGSCGPVTVRPVARPTGLDQRSYMGGGGGGWGVGSYSGSISWFGLGIGGVVTRFGTASAPPEIPLDNYPVTGIIEVKIDGVVIPPDEYELRNGRTVVRLRTSASANPTERWGWPTSQVGDLPDTENGTFSITYTYGQDPGDGGRLAAVKLAEYLVLPSFGGVTDFPTRVTDVTRQGISAKVTDAIDLLNKGTTGIYAVDLWLKSVNPSDARRQSVAWSPDRGRPRRAQSPTTS